MQAILDLVNSDLEAVNRLIIKQLHSDVELVENIGHYIIDAGGKRLRPILVLLVANALSYRDEKHFSLAAIIEFIHTATLLHDDVVDLSSLRRGRVTANAKWGNAPCVLVGDFLYSRAFQMMVEIGEMPVMEVLSDTTNIIAEGEVQQLVNAKNPNVTEDNYTIVIHKKTAALFEAACETAAILSPANDELRSAARLFGYHLGIAFQLMDDVLDYDGNQNALGKNIGDDLAEGKPTLPLIYAIANGSEQQSDIIKEAIKNGSIEKLHTIIEIVKDCGGLTYTKSKVDLHVAKAKAAIADFPNTEYKSALLDLADFSSQRSY